LEHAEDGVGIN